MASESVVTVAPDGDPSADEGYQEYLRLKKEQGPVETPAMDENQLLRMIEKLQARVDSMSAAQGIPSDPIGAAVQNLVAHVKARKAANPTFDVERLEKALTEWDDSHDVDAIRDEVDDLVDRAGPRYHSWVYLRELSRNLAREVREEKDNPLR